MTSIATNLPYAQLRGIEDSLERKVSTVTWLVPKDITASGGRLVYKQRFQFWSWKNLKRAKVTGRMLEEFVGLGEAKPSVIQAFARRFGILGLCKHGLGLRNRIHARDRVCGPATSDGHYFELLEQWRWWSLIFRATLECATALHSGAKPPELAWEILIPKDLKVPALLEPPWQSIQPQELKEALDAISPDNQWQWLMDVLNFAVLPQASLELRCFRTKDAIEMRLAPGLQESALFAVLGAELLAAVVRAKAFYTCTGCRKWFSPESLKNKPRTGQNRYCSECRKHGVDRRDAKRRQRAKEREVKQLMGGGLSTKEIAGSVGSEESTIEGWVKKKSK